GRSTKSRPPRSSVPSPATTPCSSPPPASGPLAPSDGGSPRSPPCRTAGSRREGNPERAPGRLRRPRHRAPERRRCAMTFADFSVPSLRAITSRPALVFVSGQGSWLTDHAGRRYLDFVQGWAVNCLGHSPRIIVDALTTQAARLISPSPAFYNQPM